MSKSLWSQCTSKKRYKDEYSANRYRKICQRARGVKLDYYWCHYCNGFHLTSTVNNVTGVPLLDVCAS